MNQLDVYYRALVDYRQQTLADHHCSTLRSTIATTDTEQDKIVVTRYLCTIEEDWVDAIEKGLVHVEKAIKEERQFIQSNGEVIPIEKVKHVSRESVEHLAKHSNLITQCEEDEDLIPEKLFTVERLTDYTVYENKFLYMLLCYLRDFITVRYNDIQELVGKYEADLTLKKNVSTGKQKLEYSLSMHNIKRDDPYLKASNPARDTIDRVHLLLKTVIAFLSLPLMQEVGKVPMLKPPITKTNVLKMNNNFKGAVALYEFIMAYDKKGYEIEEKTMTIAPFGDDLADELAEVGGLVSFLTYEHGLSLNKELKESYLREEERRKVARIHERAERIETLKRRLKNSEITAEEYAATLEDQLRDLEGEAIRAESLADELAAECEKTKQLTRCVENLNKTVEKLLADMEELKHRHFEEMERLKQEHEDAMHELILKHEAEMAACIEKYESEIRELQAKHEAEVLALKEKHAEEIQALKDAAALEAKRHADAMEALRQENREQVAKLQSDFNAALEEVDGKLLATSGELTELQSAHESLREDYRVAEARIKALGGVTENYTDKERFNELEREYLAFTRIYKDQWKKTKQEIKKQHLNLNNLKDQKEKAGKEKGTDSDSN